MSVSKSLPAVILVFFVLTTAFSPGPVSPSQMLNTSVDIQYGARLILNSKHTETALNTAADIHLDWLALDFDWENNWTAPGNAIDYKDIDPIFDFAARKGILILLSLTNAPDWAVNPNGPDIQATAFLVAALTERYHAKNLSAIELFPAPNTQIGWGAYPNPSAYLELYTACAAILSNYDSAITLVAGGLTPLAPEELAGNIQDTAFLESLYSLNAQFPVIGVRLPHTTNNIHSRPTDAEPRVFRHYETIRLIMLKHGQEYSSIWITGFSWQAEQTLSAKQQAEWLSEAYRYIRAQLYIQVSFFSCLNSAIASSTLYLTNAFLLKPSGKPTLALDVLTQHIKMHNTIPIMLPETASEVPAALSK